jgi:hypothetical protein
MECEIPQVGMYISEIHREQMNIPPLIYQLVDPPSGVDAVCHGDKKDAHRNRLSPEHPQAMPSYLPKLSSYNA